MKTRNIILLSFAALASMACARENLKETTVEGTKMVFTASLGDNSETKTVLQSDGSILWSPADAINIFYGENASGKFVSTNTEDAASVEFEGIMENYEYNGEDYFWAVYPYSEDNCRHGDGVLVTLPSVQTAVKGTFADSLFISVARSTGTELNFYNVCGGIKFQVPQKGIRSVTFKSRNGESVAGKAEVLMDSDGFPYVWNIFDGVDSLVLVAPDNGTFEVGVDYYMVALPMTLENGYTLTFNKSAISADISYESTVQVKRSTWGSISNDFTSSVEFKNCIIFYCSDAGACIQVHTESAYAKKYLNAGYTVIDGPEYGFKVLGDTTLTRLILDIDLTSWDCSNVTDARGMFKNCIGLTKAPDVSALTAVTNAYEMFSGCTGLTEVPSVSSMVSITNAKHLFYGCTSLKTAPDLTNLTKINNASGMFWGCTSLSTPPDLSNLTKLESASNMFLGCTSLLTAPELSTLTSLEDATNMFKGCIKIKTPPDMSNLTALENATSMFRNCSSLESVPSHPNTSFSNYYMFSGCTGLFGTVEVNAKKINGNMFENCTNIEEVIFLKGVQYVNDNALTGCVKVKYLTFASSVMEIGKAFSDCTELTTVYEKSETAPSLTSGAFDSHADDFTIYVPAFSYSRYTSNTNWGAYKQYIQPKTY